MDFLLDADKKNRRRVRLENLLLLLLRCVVVVLIAALVARPFATPKGLASTLLKDSELERIVLLDDSPSMQLVSGKTTVFDDCKDSLKKFVRDISENYSSDTLTLVLTSQPEKPVFNGQRLDSKSIDEIVRTLDALEPSDMSANMNQALLAIEGAINKKSGRQRNKALYVLTDLRQRDWTVAGDAKKDRSAAAVLRRIDKDKSVDACFLVDMANENTDNLTISDFQSDNKNLIAGFESKFVVTVHNHGDKPSEETELKLFPGDGLEIMRRVKSIDPGKAETVEFRLTIPDPGSIALRAELGSTDGLRADNERFFAARVKEALPALLVNGNPESNNGKGETLFLHKALQPNDANSGFHVTAMGETGFENESLDQFKVIYLCNLTSVPKEKLPALEAWVRGGGGLVITLGALVGVEQFNEDLYRDGKGLSPIQLTNILGDESKDTFVNLVLQRPNHPMLKAFIGNEEALSRWVNFFQWWGSTIEPRDTASGAVQVLATFSDPLASPAIVEKSFGDGQVIVMTGSMNGDWTDWPADFSFPLTALDQARYMAPNTADEGNNLVGVPIVHRLDPVHFSKDVKVKPAKREATTVQASDPPAPESKPEPDKASGGSSAASATTAAAETPAAPESRDMIVQFDDTTVRGMYNLETTGKDGVTNNLLFAANLDAAEGNLARLDESQIRQIIEGSEVEVQRGRVALSIDSPGGKGEAWKRILIALGIVLCGEQLLAWYFGKKRQ